MTYQIIDTVLVLQRINQDTSIPFVNDNSIGELIITVNDRYACSLAMLEHINNYENVDCQFNIYSNNNRICHVHFGQKFHVNYRGILLIIKFIIKKYEDGDFIPATVGNYFSSKSKIPKQTFNFLKELNKELRQSYNFLKELNKELRR